MFKSSLRLAAVLVAAACITLPVQAQTPKLIGTYKNWDAFSYKEDGGKVCYMISSPRDSKPKNVRRGDIYVMVTHRPAEKVADEVSVFAGYPYKESSEAEIEIGGTGFRLFTQGENAWAQETKDDESLVRAMVRGTTMTVRGTSKRGTSTTDTYSLSGFTAARNAIKAACGVK